MDTNFNTVIYQLEMLSLVNTAIKKLKDPNYETMVNSNEGGVHHEPDNGLRLRGKRRPL